MSSRDRQEPPGRSRIAAAARTGLFAKSERLVAGVVLLAAAGALFLARDRIGLHFKDLVEGGLLRAATHRSDPAAALVGDARTALAEGLWFLLVVFSVALVAAVGPAAWARRKAGRTVAALPKPPSDRFAQTAIGLFGGALFILLALTIVRERAGAVYLMMQGDKSAVGFLFLAAVELIAAGGLVLTLVGIADLLMTRYRIWRALFLTKSESRRERQASGEDSPVKSRRRRRAAAEVAR